MKTQDKALVLGVLLAVASAAAVVAWKADQVAGPAPLRVLIVYESADLTPSVSSILGSSEINAYMERHGDVGLSYLKLDKDTPVDALSPEWQAMRAEAKDVPAIVVKSGSRTYVKSLPGTVAETLKLLKQYGGE